VKAPAKKLTPVKKPIAKAKAKPLVKAKPLPAKKAAAKPAPKAIAKPVTKKVVVKKPVAKPASQVKKAPPAPVKSKAKLAVKAAPSKPTKPVKAVSKASAKPVIKQPIKSATLAKSAKSVPVKAKPVAKASTKTPDKEPIKVTLGQAKAPMKAVVSQAKPVAVKAPPPKPAAKVVIKSGVKPTAVPPGKALPAVVVKPGVVITPPAVKAVRTSKSGFISPSNIAPRAMEVSTAAKTNFTMSAPVLAPPPQLVVQKDAKLVNNWKKKTAAELTDAEAIAMPDSEYMSPLQLAFFRLKLVQLKKDILSNAGETTEHLREDTSVVPDPADRATIEEEHALELRTRDRERKLLKKIEQSISRIDAEDYGFCDETGEAIGVARLIARPTANLSIEAQQRRELKQKMFGD
jgi:DnaK suppressor protein